MKISEKDREFLLNELDFIAKNMDESESPDDKLFYFSGMNTAFNNICHHTNEPDFLFASFILKAVYDMLAQRLAANKSGDTVILLKKSHFEKLSQGITELSQQIEKKDDQGFTETIKKFLYLGLSATGQGFYLKQKKFSIG